MDRSRHLGMDQRPSHHRPFADSTPRSVLFIVVVVVHGPPRRRDSSVVAPVWPRNPPFFSLLWHRKVIFISIKSLRLKIFPPLTSLGIQSAHHRSWSSCPLVLSALSLTYVHHAAQQVTN